MNTARLLFWCPADRLCVFTNSDGACLLRLEVPAGSRLPVVVQRWLAGQSLRSRFLSTIGGVGRSDGSVDWGAWVGVDEAPRGLRPVSLAMFESSPDPADRRLAARLAGLLTGAPQTWIGFDPAWPEHVRAWIAQSTGTRPAGDLFVLRSDATAIVARCSLDTRTLFFTARPPPFLEPDLCDVLRAHARSAFPVTVAHDAEQGWWLTADVGGRETSEYVRHGDLPTQRLCDVMRAMADVQISTAGSADLQSLSFCVTRQSLRAGVVCAIEDCDLDIHWTARERAALLARVDALWDESCADGAVDTWIHSDPAPANVRIDGHGRAVFIDFEDPWYGPALLKGALAISSIPRRWPQPRPDREACEAAWQAYVSAFALESDRYRIDPWLTLARLVRLVRRADRSRTEAPLLLYEETPRRAEATASELRRLCADGKRVSE
jgi:hypothetical protein